MTGSGPGRFLPLVLIVVVGCATPDNGDLVGAWRSKLQFQSGDFAAIRDLEFMYVFNPGGTMTESSNYDAAPPAGAKRSGTASASPSEPDQLN